MTHRSEQGDASGQVSGGGEVEREIRNALRELDSATAATDEQSDRIGCAENALNRALAALSPYAEQASGEAWTCELIFAGYQPNGYKLLRNGEMVARIDTHDEADDEQLAHRIVAALSAQHPTGVGSEATRPVVDEAMVDLFMSRFNCEAENTTGTRLYETERGNVLNALTATFAPQQPTGGGCGHTNTVKGVDGVRYCNVCGRKQPTGEEK